MTIFQKIIDRQIPAEIIHETDDVIVVLDVHPINPGHLLVIPKQPHKDWLDMPEGVSTEVFATAQRMAKLLRGNYDQPWIALAVLGFDVDHAHVHVFPADRGDVHLEQDMGSMASPEQLKNHADQLRSLLD